MTDDEKLLDDTVSDCVSRFFWDDRKNDEELDRDKMAVLMADPAMRLQVLVSFNHHLLEALGEN
jgi:hypothetical protein